MSARAVSRPLVGLRTASAAPATAKPSELFDSRRLAIATPSWSCSRVTFELELRLLVPSAEVEASGAVELLAQRLRVVQGHTQKLLVLENAVPAQEAVAGGAAGGDQAEQDAAAVKLQSLQFRINTDSQLGPRNTLQLLSSSTWHWSI